MFLTTHLVSIYTCLGRHPIGMPRKRDDLESRSGAPNSKGPNPSSARTPISNILLELDLLITVELVNRDILLKVLRALMYFPTHIHF